MTEARAAGRTEVRPEHENPWRVRLAVAATLVALVPALVAMARLLGQTMVLPPDTAGMDILTRDVFSSHPPLIGMPGRFGFNHPGPSLFFGLAPTNLLAGGAPWGTQVGGALLQAVAIVWAARLAWRRGGLRLVALVAAAIVGTYLAAGPKVLLDAWNPNPPVPFLGVFILQVWSVAVGDRLRLIGAVVVGSFLVQTHIQWGPLVAAALVWLAVIALLDRRGARSTGNGWRTPLLASVGAGFVMWLPPLIDEVWGRGNLGNAISYTLRGEQPAVSAGWRVGAELFAAEFRLPPAWIVGDDLVDPSTLSARGASLAWLVVPIALLVLGVVAARRARRRDAVLLLSLLGVLAVATVAGMSRLERPLYTYLLTSRITIATLLVGAALWAVSLAADSMARPVVARAISATACVALLAGATNLAVDVAEHPREEALARSTVLSVAPRLERELDGGGPVILRDASSRVTGLYDGLLDELDRADAPVRVDDVRGLRYGDHRAVQLDEVERLWIVTDVGHRLSELTAIPGAQVVVLRTPLSRDDEGEIRELQRSLLTTLRGFGRDRLVGLLDSSELVRELANEPGIDRSDVERLAELNSKIERTGRARLAIIELSADNPAAATAGRIAETELVA